MKEIRTVVIGRLSRRRLYAFDENGNMINNFPLIIEFPFTSTSTIIDIDNDNELVSIKVYKSSSGDDIHGVDGISGATVTSNGVTNFLKSTLDNYKPYFDRNRN